MIRGNILYSDPKKLKEDVEKIISECPKNNCTVFRLKNNLKNSQSNILMNIEMEGVSTEIQFILYPSENDFPTPGSRA
jgi:hypothetical protein